MDWRCRSSSSGRCSAGCATGCSSTVEVAASPPAVRLGPELAFQLHQAPDPGAVGAEVRLDVGGRLLDGGQVDAEQLRAPLQRCRDRPAQVRVVPGPHRIRISNTGSGGDRERCVVRQGNASLGGPRWGRNSAEPGGQQRTAGDNESRGQRLVRGDVLGREIAGLGFHTAAATGPQGSGSGVPRPTSMSDHLRVFRKCED